VRIVDVVIVNVNGLELVATEYIKLVDSINNPLKRTCAKYPHGHPNAVIDSERNGSVG
jgi:hypothetical protein